MNEFEIMYTLKSNPEYTIHPHQMYYYLHSEQGQVNDTVVPRKIVAKLARKGILVMATRSSSYDNPFGWELAKEYK
jgi:hypothetical protein